MSQTLFVKLDTTLNELIYVLSSFTRQEMNSIPFENSWTAGQVGEHLRQSYAGLPSLLLQQTKPTDRAPDERIQGIKNIFLDFSIKMTSPAFIIPPAKDYDKDTLIQSLVSLKEEIVHAASTADLAKTCTLFEFPVIGYLTGLEIVHFIIYHTQRHLHQLKNIYENLAKNLEVKK